MQGRKPKPSNVVPLTPNMPRLSPAAQARKLCPKRLNQEERREWMRVATMLAEPTVDRLKPHYVDVITELCRASLRLRAIRQFFADQSGSPLAAEIYGVEGRNGQQTKAHPLVAQRNEVWRQWRALMAELGLSPASERGMQAGHHGLLDDPAEKYL